MTDEELTAIEARATAATAGPWAWITDRMNDRISTRIKTGGRRPKAGEKLRDLWVGLLAGPPRGVLVENDLPDWLDPWDFPHIWALRWSDVNGKEIHGFATPRTADQDFIAHARADVPALIAEVRRLRGQVLKVIELTTRKEIVNMEHDPKVQFYKDGDQFATVTSAIEPDEFLRECASALPGALARHVGDEEFQLEGLLPQMCEIWAKLKGYKADRVFEQRLLIAGSPNPGAHMTPMSAPRVLANGHGEEAKTSV